MSELKVPQEESEDYSFKAIKGLLGSIPCGGSLLAELFEITITPSIDKRREKWMENVVLAIEELKERVNNFDINKLKNSEEFVTTFIYLTQIALKSHQDEKLFYLKNALKNSILNEDIDFDFYFVLLNFVEELSPSQVIVLNFYKSNQDKLSEVNKFEDFFNEFHNGVTKNVSYNEFVLYSRDLEKKDLLIISSDVVDIEKTRIRSSPLMAANEQNQELPFVKVSNLGNAFLSFLRD